MRGLPPLYYSSPRGQCATLLLAALHGLHVKDAFDRVTRRQATDFIGRQHWFALTDEDYEPYPSQDAMTGEPRWRTLIAWARKDSVLRDLISGEEWNAWGLTRLGRAEFETLHLRCRRSADPVSQCFLWGAQFKRFMSPKYEPGPDDAKRPRSFYRDLLLPAPKHFETATRIVESGNLSKLKEKYETLFGKRLPFAFSGDKQRDIERVSRLVRDVAEKFAAIV